MRHYETIFIVHPELPEDDTNAVIDKFKGILEDGGATMSKVDLWGRRRLAYPVKKQTKGFYVLFEYGAEPGAVEEMERIFKIDENVIRFLTVKIDDVFDIEAIEAAKAAQEEAAKARAESGYSDDEADDADDADDAADDDDDDEQDS